MDNNRDINMKDGKVFPNGGAEKNSRSGKAMQSQEQILAEVQEIFERTRMLLKEIDQNYDAHETGGLNRNTTLNFELSDNMARIGNLYSDLSSIFIRSHTKGSTVAVDGTKVGCEEATTSVVEETN